MTLYIKAKQRGNCQKENIEHLNKDFQAMLGRDANLIEIRLFPYLLVSLQDQIIHDNRLSFEEQDLIEDYENKGLFAKRNGSCACTKEFFEFMSRITYDRYVCEVEEK